MPGAVSGGGSGLRDGSAGPLEALQPQCRDGSAEDNFYLILFRCLYNIDMIFNFNETIFNLKSLIRFLGCCLYHYHYHYHWILLHLTAHVGSDLYTPPGQRWAPTTCINDTPKHEHEPQHRPPRPRIRMASPANPPNIPHSPTKPPPPPPLDPRTKNPHNPPQNNTNLIPGTNTRAPKTKPNSIPRLKRSPAHQNPSPPRKDRKRKRTRL